MIPRTLMYCDLKIPPEVLRLTSQPQSVRSHNTSPGSQSGLLAAWLTDLAG